MAFPERLQHYVAAGGAEAPRAYCTWITTQLLVEISAGPEQLGVLRKT
jgi:hypothetical protein